MEVPEAGSGLKTLSDKQGASVRASTEWFWQLTEYLSGKADPTLAYILTMRERNYSW
jgi:hypothetical protein